MDHDLEIRFEKLRKHLEITFGEGFDFKGMLFLIGVNELGHGHQKYSKQEKTELFHIAVCTLLEPYGHYAFEGRDKDGWPHFKLLKSLPNINQREQDFLLKQAMLEYFISNEYYVEEMNGD